MVSSINGNGAIARMPAVTASQEGQVSLERVMRLFFSVRQTLAELSIVLSSSNQTLVDSQNTINEAVTKYFEKLVGKMEEIQKVASIIEKVNIALMVAAGGSVGAIIAGTVITSSLIAVLQAVAALIEAALTVVRSAFQIQKANLDVDYAKIESKANQLQTIADTTGSNQDEVNGVLKDVSEMLGKIYETLNEVIENWTRAQQVGAEKAAYARLS